MKPARTADAPVPFLDAEPPPLVARGLGNVLLLGFAVTLALAALIELPITVPGQFTLVPVRGTDPLRAPRGGVVAEVAAVEGTSVARGGALFRVRSELAGDRAGEAAALQIAVKGAEERLRNERARHESQAAADREQERSFTRQGAALTGQIDLAEKRLELSRQILEQHRKLYEERLTGFAELKERELDATRVESEIARLRADQEQATSSAERLRREMQVKERGIVETERQLREEAERARVRLATLKSAPLSTSSDELVVSAPCAGTVVRLHVRAAAAVVAEGDPLCEIVCEGEPLRAEVSVVDKGMGLITAGQPVKLFYDAFPYQRHGVKYATVRWIGPAGTVKPEGPAFRVLADLSDKEFRVRGAPYPLLPGMTGRAEIIVAKQSVIAYVFEPVRALKEQLNRGP